jgi:hypothetical protein
MPSGAGTVPDRGPGSGQRSLSERDQQSARYLFDVDTTISEIQTATPTSASGVGNTNPLNMLKKGRIRIFRSSRTDAP